MIKKRQSGNAQLGTTLTVGGVSVGMGTIGVSTAAINAATIILATGGAIALVLVGCGIFCYLRDKNQQKLLP